LLPAAFALLVALVALAEQRRAAADSFARDAVADFRQALLQEKDASRDKDALRFREENLTRKARALSPGDMSRVLLLQEWRVESIGEQVSDVDRKVRDEIADRFISGLREAMASNDPYRREAAASLASETAASTRTLGSGQKAGFLRQRLAGLAPELAKMAASTNPGVQQFAAEALGNIQGDPKIAARALETLIKTGTPEVRRTAADALTNLIAVLSQQEKRIRSDVAPGELRKDLLATGTFVVPATRAGMAADQPVEVRRLCADALQQLSSALVEIPLEPKTTDKYPSPGRPWTPEEAKAVEDDRQAVSDKREELRPLLEAFVKEIGVLTGSTSDADPYVRIQSRRVLQELAVTRGRLDRLEASIPKGEGVPPPRPEPKPGETKEPAPKSGGAFLPPRLPIVFVAQEKDKPAAKGGSDNLGPGLRAALPSMIAGLSDPNVRSRIEAVGVLESMGADAAPAIPALVKSLSDPNRFVRWSAVRALGRLAPRSPDLVVPAVALLLNDPDLDLGVAAATALERYGPAAREAVEALAVRVSRGDSDIRIAAMKALEAIGPDAAPALPAVARILVEKQSDFAANQELSFGDRTTPSQRVLLATLSKLGAPPAARLRVAAAETLGHFGKLAATAVPALRQALNDVDPEVRRAASSAILSINAN
jgi:HEAT repeat protein